MVKVVVGLMGSSVASGSAKMSTPDQLRPFLAMLKTHKVHELDTARVYNAGQSEEDLGSIAEAKRDFSIATKAPGFMPGSLTYKNVIDSCNASLSALKQDKIDLYYFHGPDRSTPLEESCRAINELHQQGKLERFGLSNNLAAEVEEVQSICENNGWLKPTYFQGGYNPLLRTGETELFPVLRRYGMAFYAFSPLAGGYFSKSSDQLRAPAAGGRFDQMKHFSSMYVNDLSLSLHGLLTEVCHKEGMTLKEATLRWLMHHSILGKEDGVILGGSSTEQMEENLKACEGGPLPQSVVESFEDLWKQYNKAGKAPPYGIPL